MLFYYSGLIASFFATFLIALPSLLAKYNRTKYPISWTGTLPNWKYLFNSGAILSGIFQFIFVIYLGKNFFAKLPFQIYPYALGAISCTFIGVFPYNTHKKTHIIFASGFFLLNSLGGLIFSLSILNLNPNLAIISSSFALLEIVFLFFVYKILKETGFAEISGILFSVLWAVSFYLIH